MCLVGVAWQGHADFPLIVVGNRDELHERPAAPAGWWTDCEGVYGGRDLLAGGSWLAINRSGRLAVVTNYPHAGGTPKPAASRGHLVGDFVRGTDHSTVYLQAVAARAHRYAGFCLILASADGVLAMTSAARGAAAQWPLVPGTFTVSNSPLDQPWPKAQFLDAALQNTLLDGDITTEAFFDLLAHRGPTGAASSGPELARTPFVTGAEYGTRASTVVLVNRAGQCDFAERRFDSQGELAGESRVSFEIDRAIDSGPG
jgi:uncharacterized protein with NRDE domain